MLSPKRSIRRLVFITVSVSAIGLFLLLRTVTVRNAQQSDTITIGYELQDKSGVIQNESTGPDPESRRQDSVITFNNELLLAQREDVKQLKEDVKKLKEDYKALLQERVTHQPASSQTTRSVSDVRLVHGTSEGMATSAVNKLPDETSSPKWWKNSTALIPSERVTAVDCAKLFAGDEAEMQKALKYQRRKMWPTKVEEMAKNCTTFIQERQYTMSPLNREEEEYPIAFSIILFDEVDHFERLLRSIYRPQNFYCVHVDNKSSVAIHSAVKKIVSCFPNVSLASRLIKVDWGTVSVIEAELICMKDLLKKSKAWRYFINLTGQEFPLKTNWDLVQILKVFNGSNNMEGTIERRDDTRLKKTPKPPVPVTLTKGSVHVVVRREFVEYVLYNEEAQQFKNWVSDTYVPDETFFTSLNHSPQMKVPGAYLGKPETDTDSYMFLARFKNWGDGPFNWPCKGKRVRYVCIFGVGDLPLLSSRPELFANKFYVYYESAALDCMEELHYNRTRDEVSGVRTFDTQFYQNLSFINNHL